MRPLESLVAASAIVVSSLPAAAQWGFVQDARLTNPPGGTNQAFGKSVDINGDTAVVGAPRGQTGVRGSVFVYTRSGSSWTQQAEVFALDHQTQDQFGYSVDLDGDTLVVGANFHSLPGAQACGAAYVFVRNGATWTQQAKLVANDPEQQAEFGYDVALDGDTCAIGAPQSTSNNTLYAGATYVFVRNGATWSLQQRIVPNAAFSYIYGSRSGRAVALKGDSLLIGAPTSYDLAANVVFAGRAFEWIRSGSSWTQSAVITPTDTDEGRQFGCAIDYDGARAVFGAWAENALPTGLQVGTAYVFRRAGGWVQEQEIQPAGADNADNYGTSVAIDGAVAAVGGINAASAGGMFSGCVKLFDFDGATWTERLTLDGSETSDSDRLGASVAIDGTVVIAGANNANVAGSGFSGEAYVWDLDPPVITTYCSAKTNSLGCLPVIGSSGVPSLSSAGAFHILATQVLNQKQGLLFYGYAPAAAPFQGGHLCVQPPTRRLSAQNSGGSPAGSDCSGSYSYELNAYFQSGVDPVLVAGAFLYGQFWTRDPASPSTTGLSGGVRAHLQP